MSKRWLTSRDLKPSRKLPNGRRTCRWCGKECEPPRRTWCSDDCVNEYLIRSSGSAVRAQVFRRDHGVCALCGLDCFELEAELERIDQMNIRNLYLGQTFIPETERRAVLDGWRCFSEWWLGKEVKAELHRLRKQYGFPAKRSLWESDHITPVVEGGGLCGLDNYRTLCLKCHKRETKALAGRRAMAKRPQMEISLGAG